MGRQTEVAALVVGGWIAAVAVSPAQGAHDTLNIGIAQFPSSLHPDIDPEVVRAYALGFAIRPITAFDADWKNTCLLCTELPTLENGLAKREDRPDGKHGMAVTIKLKPGLTWGDGQPVTARDIELTWRLGSNPASGFSNPNPWSRATGVDVVDDQTAVLHLDRVRADFDQWDQILPEHVEGSVVATAAGPGDYTITTNYNRTPLNPGLYNGPYLITGYDSGAQIVLEPNPHWAGHEPGFRRIVLRHIENTAALQANLLSGDVDMVAGEGIGLTIDQVLALQKQHPDSFHYTFKPSLTNEHIDLKKENPLLADVRVRRALLMAMDRQTMVDKLFHGTQPVAATWVNPLSPNYDPAIPVVKFDLAGAKALLKEAGWTPGADGICRNTAGDRLSLEFSTTALNRLRELQQQVLQSDLKNACVEVTIKNEPARTLFGQTSNSVSIPAW
jgi:peptide/nickel transport system substrate-binding protein